MFKRKLLSLAFLALAAGVSAHEGHDSEKGVFDPPHGGAFTKLAGHYAEVWAEGGKLSFCLLEENGDPAGDAHNPKNIVLKVSPKGGKTSTLKVAAAEKGCASWDYATKAKRLKVDIQANVEGKMVKATVNVIPKAGGAAMPAKHDMMAAMYTCPMHPEVKSDKPGKCPKCGMALVMKDMKGDGHAGHDHKD